ncbi:DddA-like double-stranded DNA deaminase toxin [Lentzea sp. NPDC058436]|uniref:DddA-like double-stranded DNA deaminase toxin n=1 Tax=Lentzea sp. NPDC058436 TaxID=3346499 RepID=UPI00366435FC
MQVTGVFSEAAIRARDLAFTIIALREDIHTIADNLTTPEAPGNSDSLRRTQHRDTYPPGSSGHLITAPYSAPNSGVPVEGIAQAPGAPPFEFLPQGGRWTLAAKQRLADLNAPPWAKAVDYHIELQVAAWMIASGHREVVLTINREPCGERFGKGCHQVLQAFLPRGYRLRVHGTRGGSSHYTYDYEGRSDR